VGLPADDAQARDDSGGNLVRAAFHPGGSEANDHELARGNDEDFLALKSLRGEGISWKAGPDGLIGVQPEAGAVLLMG